MRNAAWGRLKREDVLMMCFIGCRRQGVRPVYGKPQKGNVASAVWKGKWDYAIKPLRSLTAGGRGLGLGGVAGVGRGFFTLPCRRRLCPLNFWNRLSFP